MTVDFEFGVLGPLAVRRDGVAVEGLSAKQRALLAILLVHRNEVVAVDRLIDGLWPAQPPATATAVIQSYVSRLRKVLEPAGRTASRPERLVTVEPGYRLMVDDDELDAASFEGLLHAGHTALLDHEGDLAAGHLREALALWRGPALADVRVHAELRGEALRLDELRILAIEARIEADLALGRHSELVAELERLVGDHPTRERLWAQLMLCLYRSGRQAAALAAATRLRAVLREELGLVPAAEISRLEHDILSHAPHLTWAPAAASEALARTPTSRSNLPRFADAETFVGRTAELAALEEWWREPTSREPLAVLLGESGIGKTRLAVAFAEGAERAGALVLYGRALDGGGSPYEPVLSALRQFAGQADDTTIDRIGSTAAAALTRLLPELAERRPDLAARAAGWGEVDRSWLLDTVAGCLDHLRASPVLLVLDDIHWADRPALLLLSELLAADRTVRALVTCRHPGGLTGSQFADLLAELRRDDRSVCRITLRGLDDDEVAALLDATGTEPLRRQGPELAAAIRKRTNGHPLFVRECVRHLGTTTSDAAATPVATGTAQLGIPEGVRELVRQRLDHLSDATRDTLRCAAVVGVEFDLDVVAAMTDRGVPDVLSAVEGVIEAGMVSEDAAHVDRFAFHHAIVRDVIVAELTISRRARLECRAADAIEALRPGLLDVHAGEIAHHLIQGIAVGDPGRAAAWARRAGDHALGTWAYEDAVRHYESALIALELAHSSNDRSRIDVLIALGRAADRAGDRERCRSASIEAAHVARALSDPIRLGMAAIGLLGTLGPGSPDITVETLLSEAAADLRTRAAPEFQAALAEVLARHSSYLVGRDTARSSRLADEALGVARRVADDRVLALALISSTQSHALERAVLEDRLQEAELLTARTSEAELTLNIHSTLMAGALTWGDRDRFDRHLAAYAEIATRTRAPIHELLSEIDRAGAATIAGDYQQAADQLAAAALRTTTFGDPSLAFYIRSTALVVDRELGRLARHEGWLAALPEWIGQPALLSHVLCESGRRREARTHLDATVANIAPLRAQFNRRHFLAAAAEAASSLHATASARCLLPWARAELQYGHCVVLGSNGWFGALQRYLGLLALTLGDAAAAVDDHRVALQLHQQMRAPGWAARSHYDLARALHHRGRPGDGALAASHLDHAEIVAARLGMTTLQDEVEAAWGMIRP